MRGRKDGAKRFIRRFTDLSTELVSDDEVEIHSNRYALISGCKKLTEYSDSKITIVMRGMTLTVTGEYLEPESLINGKMAIKGIIKEVRYECD